MISKVIKKLRDPEYRKAFVASQINIGIPFQIRGLLQSRGWKQEDLANRAWMLQPRISALLTPGKVRPNIETLRRIAGAFDCGLQVRFVPFHELAHWSESFNPEHFSIPTFDFDVEIKQAEERESAMIAALAIPSESTYVTVTTGMGFLPGIMYSGPMTVMLDTNVFELVNVHSQGSLVYGGFTRIPPSEFREFLLPPVTTAEQPAA